MRAAAGRSRRVPTKARVLPRPAFGGRGGGIPDMDLKKLKELDLTTPALARLWLASLWDCKGLFPIARANIIARNYSPQTRPDPQFVGAVH